MSNTPVALTPEKAAEVEKVIAEIQAMDTTKLRLAQARTVVNTAHAIAEQCQEKYDWKMCLRSCSGGSAVRAHNAEPGCAVQPVTIRLYAFDRALAGYTVSVVHEGCDTLVAVHAFTACVDRVVELSGCEACHIDCKIAARRSIYPRVDVRARRRADVPSARVDEAQLRADKLLTDYLFAGVSESELLAELGLGTTKAQLRADQLLTDYLFADVSESQLLAELGLA